MEKKDISLRNRPIHSINFIEKNKKPKTSLPRSYKSYILRLKETGKALN